MSSECSDNPAPLGSGDGEIKELMGLFDVPAFARRGQDLDYSLRRIHTRCREQRDELLAMVRVRLRQWSRAAAGPDDWQVVFAAPIDSLWLHAESDSPAWSGRLAPVRQLRTVARDLKASVERFNDRWRQFLESLNLGPTNVVIDQYNKYYVLEKECVVGSARLAARYFSPVPPLTATSLLDVYPLLPVPQLRDS
ncbi:MAG: hypothetical protein ACP5XB_04740 [Isosphaeraceae bacterium]